MQFPASLILLCASIAMALPMATPDASTSSMLESRTITKPDADIHTSASVLEIRQGGGCLPSGQDGSLGIGRCYKEREIALPAGTSNSALRTECLILTPLQAKVEALEIRNNGGGACGSEGQEGSLGHGRCYKERDSMGQ